MTAWLYQMAEDESWTPESYRLAVWEGKDVTWEHKKIMAKGGAEPQAGEPLILFFAPSRTKAKGICGWAVILKRYAKRGEITFRAVPPTDRLKMSPIWDSDVEELVNSVRGPHPRGTLWQMSDAHYAAFCGRILKSS